MIRDSSAEPRFHPVVDRLVAALSTFLSVGFTLFVVVLTAGLRTPDAPIELAWATLWTSLTCGVLAAMAGTERALTFLGLLWGTEPGGSWSQTALVVVFVIVLLALFFLFFWWLAH